MPVAATFAIRDGQGASPSDVARLDTMVTVVDAGAVVRDFSSTDLLSDRGQPLGPDDERALVDLMTQQIEFADVVVLNKHGDRAPQLVIIGIDMDERAARRTEVVSADR